MKKLLPLLALLVVTALPAAPERSLLLISIDGLRNDTIPSADKLGLKIPHLRKLWAEGASASAVQGALPTSTYPSHTTIITGTAPARHGIASNQPFDPSGASTYRWFWYTEDLKVPALWDAAAAGGYEVGSVSWPVTVGASAIKYNIADFTGTRSDEDAKMIRAWAGREMIDTLAREAGPLLTDASLGTVRDWRRVGYLVGMIRKYRPRLQLAHFVAADHHQHKTGPLSPPALAAIEEIDEMVGQIVAAMREQYPDAAVCVVSDHGFSGINQSLALQDAFVRAGLITPRSKQRSLALAGVQDWIAYPWENGGSAAIVLKNPDDDAARANTREVLQALAADPANGIARILEREEIAQLGGTERATFWVDLHPGTSFSGMLGGSTILPAGRGGTHGYVPTHPEMSSTFIFSGPGVRPGDVGAIDMRHIAPTLAKFLGVSLPTADLAPLDLFETEPR